MPRDIPAVYPAPTQNASTSANEFPHPARTPRSLTRGCCQTSLVADTWHERSKVDAYVKRVGAIAPRQTGEFEMLEAMPDKIRRLLDLGCGDARLSRLIADHHPEIEALVAVDTSPPMLELARSNLSSTPWAEVREHDLNEPILSLGRFDSVVSGFAIHHVSDLRKQELFREVGEVLRPGGVFANLEVVRCATPRIHAEFYRRVGRQADDPEDVLAPVEPQLELIPSLLDGPRRRRPRWRR